LSNLSRTLELNASHMPFVASGRFNRQYRRLGHELEIACSPGGATSHFTVPDLETFRKYAPSGSGSNYTDLMLTGYYWDGGGGTYASLQSQSQRVSPGGGTVPSGAALSIRYVKDV
jgi:hypothetical protein